MATPNSQFDFLHDEWPDLFEAAAKAKAGSSIEKAVKKYA